VIYSTYVLPSFLQTSSSFQLLFTGLAAVTTFVAGVENEGDDPLQWLRDSIPGEPGVDYPIFSVVEETAFDCTGKVFGGKPILKTLAYSLGQMGLPQSNYFKKSISGVHYYLNVNARCQSTVHKKTTTTDSISLLKDFSLAPLYP
jgi:hypothetical protein